VGREWIIALSLLAVHVFLQVVEATVDYRKMKAFCSN
jgi:hypothetical protein